MVSCATSLNGERFSRLSSDCAKDRQQFCGMLGAVNQLVSFPFVDANFCQFRLFPLKEQR